MDLVSIRLKRGISNVRFRAVCAHRFFSFHTRLARMSSSKGEISDMILLTELSSIFMSDPITALIFKKVETHITPSLEKKKKANVLNKEKCKYARL